MNPEEQFDLRHYVTVLRKRIWLILTAIALCATVASLVSFTQPKVYSATAKVLLSAQQDAAVATGAVLSDPNQFQNQVGTQAQVVEAPATEEAANKILGEQSKDVIDLTASGVTNTRILQITATSEIPAVAQAAANAYSAAYLEGRRNSAINRVLDVGETVSGKRQELQNQVSELSRRISELKPSDPAIGTLTNEKELLSSQISELQTRYDAAQANALVRDAGAEPFASAELPTEPTSPKPVRNIALAVVLGALLGIGAVLLIDRFDDRLRRPDDLEQWLPGVPHLGSIPTIPDWSKEEEAKLITVLDPRSPGAEAYRALRTNIEFMALDRKLQVIQITSAIAGEGKSTTAANLAVAMAWSGKRVVVVAGDLRRPRLHQFFGLNNDVGMTSIMLSNVPMQAALQELPVDSDHAYLLSTGPLPPNPAELLSSTHVADIFEKLRSFADYIIVDSAPLLPVADSLVMSRHVDGVILSARANKVSKGQIISAASMLQNTGTGLLGTVVNGVAAKETYTYHDRYHTTVDLTEAEHRTEVSAN